MLIFLVGCLLLNFSLFDGYLLRIVILGFIVFFLLFVMFSILWLVRLMSLKVIKFMLRVV